MSKNNYPSTLELAEMLRDGGCAIIACLTERKDRRPPAGYEDGYVCVLCRVELWLSPRAIAQIAVGCLATCNECAITMAEERIRQGRAVELNLSPDAEEALARGNTVMDPARIERLRKDGGA